MANSSDIDSWKTGVESDESGQGNYTNFQKKITLIDHCVHSAGTRKDAIFTRAKNSSSDSEIRYINPAIYAESVSEEKFSVVQKSGNEQPDNFNGQIIDTKRSNCRTINLPSAKDATDSDQTAIEHSVNTGQNTYRCYSTFFPDSFDSSTGRSAVSSRTIARTERRCKISSIVADVDQNEAMKQDNQVESRQVVRIFTTSLSDISSIGDQESNESDLDRRTAHSEWIRKKHEDARRKKKAEDLTAKKLQEEEERIAREKEKKARLEKENFLKWVEKKRQQELDRKATLESELELQEYLKEIEEKAAVAKALYLRQWIHKKKEEQKTRHRDQEMRQKKVNEERARRLEQSSRAYEKWREESKNRPKPATQGLLPHQKAKPTYVNPIPWQSIIEVDSDEERRSTLDDKGNIYINRKMNGRKSIAVHQ